MVRLDDNLNIQPDLAYKWEIDTLATTYTFHLRPKVYFHSDPAFGEKQKRTLVAADVEYSLNRVRADKTASPGAWVMQKVADIKALDDLTLEIKLKEAFPAFLSLLTMKYCAVVPHEAVSFYGDDFRKHPVGTGPFYLKNLGREYQTCLKEKSLIF